MGGLERIRSEIRDFAGYDGETQRRLSDEQIRAFAGEALAAISDGEVAALSPADREHYDRLLLRAEFMNFHAFKSFEDGPSAERIQAVLEADLEVILAAKERDFARLQDAFDRRDRAMQPE